MLDFFLKQVSSENLILLVIFVFWVNFGCCHIYWFWPKIFEMKSTPDYNKSSY